MPSPYREYLLPGDWTVLVGRTDADNDRLSLREAAQDDLWFHVRGCPGSHVLLRAREGEHPPPDAIRAAAAIAAWHSKARKAGVVPVIWTHARNVSKPRGAKAGTVTVRREVVVKVRPALPPGAESDG